VPEIIVTLGDSVVNRFVFEKDIVSIGRSRDNDVVIENLAISRNHARIRHENGKFFISDLNSANGTFVNGKQVTKSEISHNDVITIGKHTLIFKNEVLTDEAMISDAFGAERTMIVDRVPVAILRVTHGKQKDQEFRVEKAEITIGRSKGCAICLPDWFVGKEHAVIQRRGDTWAAGAGQKSTIGRSPRPFSKTAMRFKLAALASRFGSPKNRWRWPRSVCSPK
jgi:pSer/pThr/pTyr-binding forkhead associated (FHA) protein